MKLIVLCILFLGFSSTQGNIPVKPDKLNCNCGWITSESGKITYPWLVEILNKVGENHLCTGTILTQWHVIATASCLKTFRPEDILVCITGKGNKCDFEDTRVHVKRITLKKRFIEVNGMNDLSMIRTENEIEFNEHVSPVCFPHKKFSSDRLFMEETEIIFVGFEKTGEFKKISFQSRDNSQCGTLFPIIREDRHLCALNVVDSQQNVKGDSGAFFMIGKGTDRYTLIGILARSLSEIKIPPAPSVITNFSVFRGWANNIVFGKRHAHLCFKE